MATDHDRQQAQKQAADHRRRAGELFADHAREQDPGKQRELLSQAQQENAEAARWDKAAEHQAGGTRGRSQEHEPAQDEGKQKQEDSFSRDGEAASDSDRRAWYLPGSVADDKILQAEEAQQGSLMGELVKYAARSVVDKDHRTFEGAKLVGKAASIPAKGAAHAGKAAVKGVGAAARGAGAVTRTAHNTGKAILEAAANHKAKNRGGQVAGIGKKGQDNQLSRTGRSDKGHGRSQKGPGREQKTRTKTRDREPGR